MKAYVTVWGYCLLGRGKVHRFPHGVQRGRMVYGPWGIRLPALELCGTCLQPQQWPPEAVELNRLQQEAMREERTDGRDTAASL